MDCPEIKRILFATDDSANAHYAFSYATCYAEKDWMTVLQQLLDSSQPVRVRLKAAEMTGDFGELEAIDPLRSARFGNEKLQKAVDTAIAKMHDRYYTRECPFCAEIIKKRAKICKHCGKDVVS